MLKSVRSWRNGALVIHFFAALSLAALTGDALGQAPQSPATAPAQACAALSGFKQPALEISSAAEQPAGPFNAGPGAGVSLPAHCLVKGVLEKRTGVNAKPYGIYFEMRLPDSWNGRFLFQGGGGTNGVVRPAIGSVKGPAALASGFAVISQDAGHEGDGAGFGEDQQARIDMDYRSYDVVTSLGKNLVKAYYGRAADHSYFMGCSEGGREALLVSQRMPMEYDGVVAGDPGFQLGVSLDSTWSRRVLLRIAPKDAKGQPDISRAFSDADLKLAANHILKTCDAKDGLEDGLIDNAPACRVNLSPLTCKGRKTDQCLSAPQVGALKAILEGGKDEHGAVISQGFPYDTGIGQPSFRQWKLSNGSPIRGAVSPAQGLFMSPYDESYTEDGSLTNFDRERAGMIETGSLYRADAVSYSTFKGRGAKLLIYTGGGDPIFSPKVLTAYYNRLAAANGGMAAAQDFARLFLVPGMTHCRAGQALDEFDPLSAMVGWVEKGVAPRQLITTGRAFPGRSRPICPYPQQSRYRGTGSIEDAANFECRIVDPANGGQSKKG